MVGRPLKGLEIGAKGKVDNCGWVTYTNERVLSDLPDSDENFRTGRATLVAHPSLAAHRARVTEFGKGLYRARDVAVRALKEGRLGKLPTPPEAARKKAAAAKKAATKRCVIVDHMGEAVVGVLVAKNVARKNAQGVARETLYFVRPKFVHSRNTSKRPNDKTHWHIAVPKHRFVFGAPDDKT